MKDKVYIAFPVAMSGNINVRLINFILQTNSNYEIEVGCVMGHQIAHNRNVLTKLFLKTDCEWIFFVDTDTIPPTNALDMTKHKLDICSGYYYQWADKRLTPLLFKRVKDKYNVALGRPTKIKNVVEVDATGAGCLLINRRVFEDIEKPYFLTPYSKEGIALSTEDIYFFRKVIKAGYKVHVDMTTVAKHIKTVDLLEVAQWNYKVAHKKNK